jgi:ferredoxin
VSSESRKVLVNFSTDEMEVEAPHGTHLATIADASRADLTFGCRRGTCGTCRVEILSGWENLSQPTAEERAFLEKLPDASRNRLACQVRVLGDVALSLPKK